MARQPTLVQMTPELLTALDRHVARTGRSRSELVREAVAGFLAADAQASVDAQMIEGYTRHPETDEELRWAEAALRQSISEEPW